MLRRYKKSVQLNWATSKETNNSYFTIEKSSDGKLFKTLIIVPANRDNVENDYTYTDAQAATSLLHYTLTNDLNTFKMTAQVQKGLYLLTVEHRNERVYTAKALVQ